MTWLPISYLESGIITKIQRLIAPEMIKRTVKKIPVLRDIARWAIRRFGNSVGANPVADFAGSQDYWERRYRSGGNSGVGSYSKFARFKADTLNQFVEQNEIRSIIEFGCGDGSQLKLARYPAYLGFDVSPTAVETCRRKFATDPDKSFELLDEFDNQTADASLSLDVIYHLVEDTVFESHMAALFRSARRYVVIYSSDEEKQAEVEDSHVRLRRFTDWIERETADWTLIQHIPNPYPYVGDARKGSWSDFFIYRRNE